MRHLELRHLEHRGQLVVVAEVLEGSLRRCQGRRAALAAPDQAPVLVDGVFAGLYPAEKNKPPGPYQPYNCLLAAGNRLLAAGLFAGFPAKMLGKAPLHGGLKLLRMPSLTAGKRCGETGFQPKRLR